MLHLRVRDFIEHFSAPNTDDERLVYMYGRARRTPRLTLPALIRLRCEAPGRGVSLLPRGRRLPPNIAFRRISVSFIVALLISIFFYLAEMPAFDFAIAGLNTPIAAGATTSDAARHAPIA